MDKKPELKINQRNYVECTDFDKVVKEVYGKPYNFQQQDGCQSRGRYNLTVPTLGEDFVNDTIEEVINGYDIGVSLKSWLARDPKQLGGEIMSDAQLERFWERSFYPSIEALTNDLYEKGIMEAGEYSIIIDW